MSISKSPETPSVPNNLNPYLNEIAERLFSGHAAVMIGSGLSKNARRHSPSSPDFPDWAQLGDRFYQKLHNREPSADNRYLSVPKLAHEIEAAIGRPALDQLLRDAIPDRDYEPSPLHAKLLELPWTDVFTTNYDTLLERTCGSVTSRRYDVVVNLDDLVYSERPRIVKLHGSFPADRPFVVTDEDYRRYPETFAPFVNTVRQSLLENTLCLIGFSGDDPNFLQWIGWIHDNLGQTNSPKMYLVGMLRLSESQRKLLERRNIVSVDMSHCDDLEPDDHERSLEIVIDYIGSRKARFNTLDWPLSAHIDRPDEKTDIGTQIAEQIVAWKAQRRSYPGWIVVPDSRRKRLWIETKAWAITSLIPEKLPHFVDLEFAFELTWRMERCQSRILDSQTGFLEATLNRYLRADTDTQQSASMEDGIIVKLTQNEISDMCHHVLLALLRYYREEGRMEEWSRTRDKLQIRVTKMSPDHVARFHYERALFALFDLHLQEFKQRIEEWPVDDSLPFWEARRAGLLAEIGQVGDAARILENSLATIRAKSNLKPVTIDYSLISQESFVMLLLRSVQLSAAFRTGEFSKWGVISKDFTERWHTLREYDCDPWNELEAFERALDRPPAKTPQVIREPAFDIGRVTETRHFESEDVETLTAYGFLRFCEDAGVPFRMPGCTIAKKGATGALSRIATHSPYWAMATLVRIGEEGEIGRIFDRPSLAGMDTAFVDLLVDRYLKALDLAAADIGAGIPHWDENFGTLLAKVVPEILSRLCCMCSRSARARLFDFLLGVYRSERKGRYRGVRNLTERLLEAVSVDERIELMPRLLEFPIPSDLNAIEIGEYRNPFIFAGTWGESVAGRSAIPVARVVPLIDSASSRDQRERRWATSTLGVLHGWRILDPGTTARFAEVLWAQLDHHDLPLGTDYLPHAFLTLPHPTEIRPSELLKKWVREQQFPTYADGAVSRPGQRNPLCSAIIGASSRVEWSDGDVHSIVHRLVKWWDADKEHARRFCGGNAGGATADEFRRGLSRLVDSLVAVISPPFNPPHCNGTRDVLERVTGEMSEHRLAVLRLDTACLHLFPEKRDDVLRRIEEGIVSSSEETVVDAMRSGLVLSERIRADATEQERNEFIRILEVAAEVLRWRRETGLPLAINTVAAVTTRHPWSFAGAVERSVLEGLRHMIGDSAICSPSGRKIDRNRDCSDVATKLIVRRAAAGLAYRLSKYYASRRDPTPGVIGEWELVCRSDQEFAEIRNQWVDACST